MEILIQNRSKREMENLEKIRGQIKLILKDLGCPQNVELSLVFMSNSEISQLNEKFLGKKGPTNVIAFPQKRDFVIYTGNCPQLLGDIVVGIDFAYFEAESNNLNYNDHLLRLLIHGLLHLLGYDHERGEEDAVKMEKITERLLFVSRGSFESFRK